MVHASKVSPLPGYAYLAALAIGIISFVIALFSQHVLVMAPCAWCVFQRLILLLACIFALMAFIFHQPARPKSTLVMGILLFGSTVAGIASAWHQYTVAAKQFSRSEERRVGRPRREQR